MKYDLDRLHSDIPDTHPVGLPLVYWVKPDGSAHAAYRIFDLQFQYLFGPLPEGHSFRGRFVGTSDSDLEISGPVDHDHTLLREELEYRTGLQWQPTQLMDRKEDAVTDIVLTARTGYTGTSWMPVPVWLTELGGQIHTYREALEVVQISEPYANLSVREGEPAKDVARNLLKGIPSSRLREFETFRSHRTKKLDSVQFLLGDWKKVVSMRYR